MISNQELKARLTASLLVLALTVTAGCSAFRHKHSGTESAPVQAATSSGQPAPAQEMTATEAAVAGGDSSAATEQPASTPNPAPVLNPGAPKSYTVKRGDTLWGIATMFLRDPWTWPEVWYVNPQIENPHLIYPGDVLALAYGADGRPQISLVERGSGNAARLNPRLRSTSLDGAIPPLPYSEISAFLSRPTIVTADDLKHAPHVVAFRDRHIIGGSGMEVYVRGLNAPQNARYSVLHIGDEIRDPDDGKVVGYQGVYTATAVITKPGEPAKAELSDSARETLQGDRLFASDETDVPLNFVPTAPKGEIKGRIVSVVDGVDLIGQYQIVVINRGRKHGIEIGNILAIDQAGDVVRDHGSSHNVASIFASKIRLPDERNGTLMVFKTFDRVSYGLILGAVSPIRIADVVRSP